jgi:N-sulfoglucosamine sulfohydrolase
VDALVSNVDLFPTLLRAAGLPLPEPLHGYDLGGLLAGDSAPVRDAVYAEMTYHDYYDPRRAIRANGHKLVLNFTMAPAFMDPTQSWRPRTRPVVPANPATAFHPLLELYDLTADPHEWHNLAGDPAHAATQRDLLARLHTWMQDTDDPLLSGAITSPTHARAVEVLEGTTDVP